MDIKTWSEEEIAILKNNYKNLTNSELVELFPNKTALAIYKKAYSLGMRKTKEISFLNRSIASKGERNHNWNGGIKMSKKGYRFILKPEHERADSNGYVLEHIVVWEQHHNTKIPDGYIIHHINKNKCDNNIDNLMLMSAGEHIRLHHLGRKLSEESKSKISQKAKARLSNPQNHPCYKAIDMDAINGLIRKGETVNEACKKFNISKRTYYNKLKETRLVK